jgi:enterochelin esterase-like enzyme
MVSARRRHNELTMQTTPHRSRLAVRAKRRQAAAVYGRVVCPVAVLLATLLGAVAGSGSSQAQATTSGFSPVVQRTGKPPTGYTVTFRYRNPRAKSVYLEGEWYFSSPGHASPYSSQGLLPTQWEPGDFPLGWPNIATTAGWPLSNMKKDPRTGVWSYTAPLPSGEFNYSFAVNCTDAEMASATGCPTISDPSNPPWNDRHGVSVGSVEPTSQVYVPSDPAFHTVNYWWQAPTSPHGALRDVTYAALSGTSSSSPGANYLAVYTPPGYEPHRSTPYPTLYLSAGYVSNEVDWSTRADAASILDHLIDKGQVEPMVVVMTNFAWAAFGLAACSGDGYDQNLISRVIPFVQSHYDVSAEPSQRAFAGLSCGGGLAVSLLLDDPNEFGYYGAFSPYPGNLSALTPAQASSIKKVQVLVGGGKDDPIHFYAQEDVAALNKVGIKFFSDFINGGHDWYVWRILLHDFLARVAFRPTSV